MPSAPGVEDQNPLIKALKPSKENLADPVSGTREILRLLNEDADPNAKSNVGNTALWYASCRGLFDVVRRLVELGADVNATSFFGNETPLIGAVRHAQQSNNSPERLGILNLLLERSANLGAIDKNGWTALDMAARYGNLEVVKILVAKGSGINHKDNDGMTSFMWAALEGHVEVMRFLAEHGADINVQNCDGETALYIAIQQRDKAVLDVLIRYGAEGISDLLVK